MCDSQRILRLRLILRTPSLRSLSKNASPLVLIITYLISHSALSLLYNIKNNTEKTIAIIQMIIAVFIDKGENKHLNIVVMIIAVLLMSPHKALLELESLSLSALNKIYAIIETKLVAIDKNHNTKIIKLNIFICSYIPFYLMSIYSTSSVL